MDRHVQELVTLKTIAESLNQSNDLTPMLNSVLKKLLELTGLTTGWIFLEDGPRHYRFVADHHLPPALQIDDKQPMRCGDCWCMDRYWAGRLKNAVNILNCKRIEDAIEHRTGDTYGITHHATVPLKAGNRRLGVMNVASPGKSKFTDEELALLEAVALQIGSAIERVRLFEAQQQRARMEERNRLARDLHDSVSQMLFSLSMTAKGVESLIASGQLDAARDSIRDIQSLSQNALKEMRALIMQLRPAGLEAGLLTALKAYGSQLGLTIDASMTGVRQLPRHVEEALWRIGQEALNNVIKHAGVLEAKVELEMEAEKVVLRITDKGRGMTTRSRRSGQSIGLSTMRERCEALGGRFALTSLHRKGTVVEITLPLEVANP
ncbi:GAF domain-containing sensor histidine kinase [Cohnella pontilimi]|uniref:Oxygen sensor histidine kinase NreB n=1 Tax=Cohnella pontilimi TaxID=2564100 RepID=A0A4U0F8S0_9BACL|nr:GAF domain-containing sensor histidine kinase [Cohnella pontilimi]TJY40858.1 GAF domain-containing sensor histidine kinase [Cohnella pontilimi]